jgi:hypothetical protein
MSIASWSKFCPVDFNRDFAACLIFLPCTTSPAVLNPVFKASRPRVFAPFFVSGAEDDYIDLANTYLFVEAQIVDDDDTALDGGEDVGPVNL